MKKLTYFAPAKRTSEACLKASYQELKSLEHVSEVMNGIPYIALIINNNRQVVFGNKADLETFGLEHLNEVLGGRPGELIHCVHAEKAPSGCGTSKHCSLCGAVNAILESQNTQRQVTKECRITSKNKEDYISFDLRVTVSPFEVSGEKYSIFSVLDISNEKRKQSLERIFFHDILNTAGGLKGFIDYLKQKENFDEFQKVFPVIEQITDTLIGEILTQSDISAAESGELQINKFTTNSSDFIKDLIHHVQFHEVSKNKNAVKMKNSENFDFYTDHILLKRVLINLMKNAFEAIDNNQSVKIGVFKENDKIIFKVNNPGVIPLEAQFQIFQRSFSTKGMGRGLGTYSVKLIVEKYLNGSVYFKTGENQETTFFVELAIEEK